MLDSEGEWPRMRIAIAGKTQSRKYAQKKNTPGPRTYLVYAAYTHIREEVVK